MSVTWIQTIRRLGQRRHKPHHALKRRRILEHLEERQLLAVDLQLPTYTQSFDNLFTTVQGNNTTVASTVLPLGWSVAEAGASANNLLRVDAGSSTTGDTFLYGATASNERALGGLNSGSVSTTFGVEFTNQTGATIVQLDVAYTGEQWRLGATSRVDQLIVEYSTDATSLTTGTWLPAANLNFVAPVTTGTIGALVGNNAPNRSAISGSIASVSVLNGETIWLRWVDQNPTGSDDGIAVDDITVTPITSSAPVESSFVLINEILFDTTGTDTPHEYVELRGQADTVVPANTYLVNIEGDIDSGFGPGKVSNIFNLSGLEFGSNGYLVLAQNGSGYSFSPAANVLISTTSDFGGFTFFQSDVAANQIENATNTFILITSSTAPALTDDVDTTNSGLLDGPSANWTVRDSLSVSDGDSGDFTYSTVLFNYFDSVTPPLGYVARKGNSTGQTSADWVGAELAGTAPNFTLAVGATSPANYGGLAVNHIGSSNPLVTPVPTVDLNRVITVNPGQRITLSNSLLSASDPDTAAAGLIYTVVTGPSQGSLTKNGVAITSFTQADLEASDNILDSIRYTTTGSAGSTDSITLSLSDGNNVVTPIVLNISIAAVSAPVGYSTGDYTQAFNNLLPSPIPNDSSTLPVAMVLPQGWYIAETSGTNDNANSSIRIDSNVTTSGDTFLLGATTTNERAFGMLASGSLTSRVGVAFVNNTAQTFSSFSLSYTGEQWRDGRGTGSINNTLTFDYSIGATSLTTGTYTSAPTLDFAAPVGGANPQIGTDTPLDGNLTANQSQISATVNGIGWGPGETLWLRWSDINDAGNDDLLGIDNLTFNATAPVGNSNPVLVNNSASLLLGITSPITSSMLLVTDTEQNAGSLTYTVGTASTGQLNLNGAPIGSGATFTQTDINSGKLTYTAPLTGTSDSITFTVSDGAGGTLASTPFNITLTSPPSVLLNELNVNPPGTDTPREYIEIIGVPGASLNGVYFASIEGDVTSNEGNVTYLLNLSGQVLGSNGLLFIGSPGAYTIPSGTTFVDGGTTFASGGALQNGANTFALIYSGNEAITATDYDPTDVGTLTLPGGALMIDSVGWVAVGVGDKVYGGVSLTQVSGVPNAASRIVGNSNRNPTAWFNGALSGSDNSSVTYNATNSSSNLPTGAVLTPGDTNFVAPPPPASLSIAATDATKPEGNSGTTNFTFTVTRSGNTTGVTTSNWTVTAGTTDPANGLDFIGGTFPSGTVTFQVGESTQVVTIAVAGDTTVEPNESFVVTLSNPSNGTITTDNANGAIQNDDTPPTTLTVSSLTGQPSGFAIGLSQAINSSLLNMFDSSAGLLGPSDISLVGATVGAVRGSVVVNPNNQQLTFIKSGGPLAPDTYTVTLRSAADGFVNGSGELLDGDANGSAGGDYTNTFIVVAGPTNEVIVSIPDFSRGFGQAVNLPNNSTLGIPITLSTGQNVAGVDFDLVFDPALLSVTGFSTGIAGASAAFNLVSAGVARVTVSSASDFSTSTGQIELGRFTASVPNTAPYGAKQILNLVIREINNTLAQPQPSRADAGIHITSFVGDANGSNTYSSADSTLSQRLTVGLGTGLTAFQLADPLLITDMNRSDSLTSGDTTLIQRLIVGIPITQAPPLPTGINPPAPGGVDPKLFIPNNLKASQSGTVTVPVMLEVTEPKGITVSGIDLAITYDPAVFKSISNFVFGTDFLGSGFASATKTDVPGQIRISISKGTGPSLQFGAVGTIISFDATIATEAVNGPSIFNLMQNVEATFTSVTDNDLQGLVLIPAPTNATTDVIDGVVMIGTVVPADDSVAAVDAVKEEAEAKITALSDIASPNTCTIGWLPIEDVTVDSQANVSPNFDASNSITVGIAMGPSTYSTPPMDDLLSAMAADHFFRSLGDSESDDEKDSGDLLELLAAQEKVCIAETK